MADQDEMVATFIDITQANPDHVRSFLASQGWNLENAIARFFDLGERSISSLAETHRQAEARERAERERAEAAARAEEEEEEEEDEDGLGLFGGDDEVVPPPVAPIAVPVSASSSSGGASSPRGEDSKKNKDKAGFSLDFGPMFTEGLFTDCVVRAGQELVEIPAHRAVLSQFSAFFARAFRNTASTTSQQGGDVEMSDSKAPVLFTPPHIGGAHKAAVDVPDVPADIMKHIISLMYSRKIQVAVEDAGFVVDLLLAAGRLECPTAEAAFAKAVFATKDSVSAVLKRVLSVPGGGEKSESLMKECLLYLEESEEHCEGVLFDPSVVGLMPPSVIGQVLKSPNLPLSEIDVFKAALTWARAQAAKSSMSLSDAFSEVKSCVAFNKLGFAQIRDHVHVEAEGIFDEDELIQLYGAAQIEDDDAPRSFKAANVLEVHRGDAGVFGRSWSYSGTPDQIDFEVSERIRLCGYGLFLSRGDLNITVRLLKGSEVINEATQVFNTALDRAMGTIYFRRPTVLEPGVRYTAFEQITGSASTCSIQGGRSPITAHGVTFTYFSHSGSTNGTDVGNGQIPILYFKKIAKRT